MELMIQEGAISIIKGISSIGQCPFIECSNDLWGVSSNPWNN